MTNRTERVLTDFYTAYGLSGEALKKLILDELRLDLDINFCRGQGYDGAEAVAGYISGLSARILEDNPKALYVHCYSHRLNLAITHSCSIPLVRNTFQQIKEISYFCNLSEPRKMILERNILKYCPDSKKKKLKDVCRTRWVERVDGMDVFQELFIAIFLHWRK